MTYENKFKISYNIINYFHKFSLTHKTYVIRLIQINKNKYLISLVF